MIPIINPSATEKIINNAIDERQRKLTQYEKYAKSLDTLLRNVNIFKVLGYYRDFSLTSTPNKIVVGTLIGILSLITLPIVEITKLTLAVLTSPLRFFGIKPVSFRPISWSLFQIAKHANEPEMQKMLVEKTPLLNQIGENKELVKELVKDFALTGDDKNTKLLRDVANATLDMLGNENSRKALQSELVNNYYKFNVNADRNQFIENYIKYEKSQIKNTEDLHHIVERKNQRELNIGIQNLKNSIVNVGSENKSRILKTQLTNELKKLDIKEADITKLLEKHKNFKLSDAQYILQQKYAEALQQQYSALKTEIGENPSVEGIREKADSFLREEAEYKFDVQEKEYLDSYVKDYVRFEQGKGNTKTSEELTQEATEIYLRQAPDYMRLTENVLNIVARQEEGRSNNLKGVLREQGKDLIEYFKDTKKENAMLQGMMENFGIDDKLLDVAPSMLDKPEEIADIVHAIRSNPLFVWAEDLMDKMIANPELKKTFQEIPELASNVAIGMVNSIPFLKNMCDDFGCSEEVLEIIKEVVQMPEKTKQILHDMNKGDYGSLVKNTLKLIAEKKSLQNYLKENGQAYATLVSALFKQLEPMRNMKENYGLNDKDIDTLMGVIPHVLNDPAKLNVFYDKLGKEKYVDMMVEVNNWAKDNEGLKEYLQKHAQGIGVAIGKAIPHTPANAYIRSYLSEINLNIQGLVSAALQHDHLLGSDNISNMLQGLKTGDLPTMLTSIDKIIDEPNIRETLSEALGKENMELVLKLSKIVNMEDLKEAIKIYGQDKDYYKLAVAFLGNEHFKTLLIQEKENIANFAKFLVEKMPMVRDLKNKYLGSEIKINELIRDMITPKIIEGIEAYVKSDRGKLVTMKFVWDMSSLVIKFPILDYFLPTPTQSSNLTAKVKSKVNTYSKEGKEIKNLSELLKERDTSPELKKAVEQKSLAGINLSNVNFNMINIDSFSFANAKFNKASFQGRIENASFVNSTFNEIALFEGSIISDTNFADAKFKTEKTASVLSFKKTALSNVNFEGIKVDFGEVGRGALDFSEATIDAYTLESLAKTVTQNPALKNKLNFDGVRIIGDLSERDLSNLSLKGANFSDVTSMRGTILNGVDLTDVEINRELLKESIDLHNANSIDQETINAQKKNRQAVISDKIAKAIVNNLVSDDKLTIAENKAYSSYVNDLAEKLKADIKMLEPGMVNHIYDLLETNYVKLKNFDFKNDAFKNYNDLASNPQIILKPLLEKSYISNQLSDENLGNILKYEMMKNLIADTVGKELFGEGYNRGKDFMLIREHLSIVFSKLNHEEKQDLCQNLIEQKETSIQLKQPDGQELVNMLRNKYYAQTKYTTIGLATSGIYLTENSLDKLVDSDLVDIKSAFSREQQQINDLAKKLGEKGAEKLFGTNMSTSRQADAKKIVALFQYEILPNIMEGLTQEKKQELFKANVDTLVGNYGKGYWGKRENHSLSQILYDNTSYTKMGYASGGVQVDDIKLHSKNCKDAMISCIKEHLEPSKGRAFQH